MDTKRVLELAGLNEGFMTDKNLHASGTGKTASTGTAGPQGGEKKPEEPNLKLSGTGKTASTGTAGPKSGEKKPEVANLKPSGTGKTATTGSGPLMEESAAITAEIIEKVTVLSQSLTEADSKFADYRLDALKRIQALVNQYVD